VSTQIPVLSIVVPCHHEAGISVNGWYGTAQRKTNQTAPMQRLLYSWRVRTAPESAAARRVTSGLPTIPPQSIHTECRSGRSGCGKTQASTALIISGYENLAPNRPLRATGAG